MKKIFYICMFLFLCGQVLAQENLEVKLNLKLFLEGPYKNNLMKTTLKEKNFIPLSQPYNVLPWEYAGNEKVDNIPDSVVDWILVELSKEPNESSVTNRKACFLKSNGDVFDINNEKGIDLKLQKNKNYYIIVHHRNHLSVISSEPLTINNLSVSYDFTKDPASAEAKLGNENFGMLSGDSDSNGIVNNLDFKEVANHLFEEGYLNSDLDMNGIVNVLDYGQANINISKKSILPGKPNF